MTSLGQDQKPLVVRVAALALIYVFPLYPLVPRFGLLGPLGTDDVLPLTVLALCVPAVFLVGRVGVWRRELVALAVVAALASLAAVWRAQGLLSELVAVART